MSRLAHHLARALAFLAAAVLLGVAANHFAAPSRKLAWLGRTPTEPAAPPADPPADPPAPEPAPGPVRTAPRAADPFHPSSTQAVREISSEVAWSAFGRRIPFLDARRTSDFEEGHVAGAWSAPVWESDCDRRITEFEARANPGMKDPVVIYCTGGCEDSKLLAAKLQGLGYRNLLVYTDGFPDWTAKARPVAKGPRP
ncbi:rhodanese-like domain-containing protein [Geothrix sp. 21YS21S-2]|uniref:rhodanese-like domain-containing protein n=1 Tax=Geothrix sp. 21YS21S-2 TaxID=3068893 RepID=UPI0027BAC905|nr:rhodanese-like domain-containing protein [Geothrix sp. 21YS21S-2]